MGTEDETELTQGRRCLAAAGAAVVAATIVNPFDVVKTRMQAQALPALAACSPSGCYNSTLYEKWGICEEPLCVRRTPPRVGAPAMAPSVALTPAGAGVAGFAPPPEAAAPALADLQQRLRGGGGASGAQSMWGAFRSIVRAEGLPVMWRGTGASLLISAPMVGVYMPLYDDLLARADAADLGRWAPVLAGSASRTVAVFCVAPFELLRTRLQAGSAAADAAAPTKYAARQALAPYVDASSARSALRSLPRLWTGFSATLLRDVPFSALYWAMVEPLRHAMLPRYQHLRLGSGGGTSSSSGATEAAASTSEQHDPCHHFHHTRGEILAANMVSGFVAGGLAAAVTTPFDVVKTRQQLSSAPPGGSGAAAAATTPLGAWATLRSVAAAEGVPGLFRGVAPRASRAAPACAIVISVYEWLKAALTPP